jgi:hypothetical protein
MRVAASAPKRKRMETNPPSPVQRSLTYGETSLVAEFRGLAGFSRAAEMPALAPHRPLPESSVTKS